MHQRSFYFSAAVGFVTAFALSIYVLWLGWSQPIIDMHGFRQTQTALTTYWLLHGGDWLTYETPVLGAPWAIPMEFPLYQWAVASVAKSAPVSLDQAGRGVSYAFFALCLWPLRTICHQLRLTPATWLAASAMVLMAPVYLFWSRAFMIESTALLLALAFVTCHLRWLADGSAAAAFGALLALSFALLVKVTTAVPFGLLAALLSVESAAIWVRQRNWTTLAGRASVSLAIAAFASLLMLQWVHYVDALKARSPFGSMLTSSALHTWNFGTLDQRTSYGFWLDTIVHRAVPESIGSIAALAAIFLLAQFATKRAIMLASAFLLAWLSSFLIFPNLHIVHNYYQYSNAILIVVAAGIVIGDAAKRYPIIAIAATALVIATQLNSFSQRYRPALTADNSRAPIIRFAEKIKDATPFGSAIIVSIGDWASTIAYYSERRSLTLPESASAALLDELAVSPEKFVEPEPLSAIINCRGLTRPEVTRAVDSAISNAPVQRVERLYGCDLAILK